MAQILNWSGLHVNGFAKGSNVCFSFACSLGLCDEISSADFYEGFSWGFEENFESICHDFGAALVEFEGGKDHVHLLVNYPPKVSVSRLVNSLKGVSSRMVRLEGYESIQKHLWGNALWSPSYFAGACGGAPLAVIRQYIEQQKTPEE
jgi:putative transposase